MAPYVLAVYACVAIALHELVFRRSVDDDGLTTLGAKVFAWAWPLWASCIVLVWLVALAFDIARWWRKL